MITETVQKSLKISRPKSLFGKIPYLEEQTLFVNFLRPFSKMGIQINPEKYSLYLGLPKIKEVRHPDLAKKDYQESYAKAKSVLNKMGV